MTDAGEDEDKTVYKVVVNHEEQYSIWPEYRENPRGWRDAGKSGPKAACLAHIKEVWTDMRPLSLRLRMEEAERARERGEPEPVPAPAAPAAEGDDLVSRLSRGEHRIEVALRPERTAAALRDCITRGFAIVRFIDTRGPAELGVRLDRAACDLADADFAAGTGRAHIEGTLTLDYVRVRCVADVELATLSGTGCLERLPAPAQV